MVLFYTLSTLDLPGETVYVFLLCAFGGFILVGEEKGLPVVVVCRRI